MIAFVHHEKFITYFNTCIFQFRQVNGNPNVNICKNHIRHRKFDNNKSQKRMNETKMPSTATFP